MRINFVFVVVVVVLERNDTLSSNCGSNFTM